MKIISILNQKGGVGKTTSTINLAKALIMQGKNVLVIDLDQQSSLTISLGIDLFCLVKNNIKNFILKKGNIKNYIQVINDIHIIKSGFDLAGFDITISTLMNREHLLLKAFNKNLKYLLNYDFILIDNPPNLSLLTHNSLTASDYALIPIKLDYLGLCGTSQLLNTIEKIQDNTNEGLKILGMFGTFFDNTNDAKKSLNNVKEFCKNKDFKLFDTYIRVNTKLKEAPKQAKDIFSYCEKCNGAEDYMNLSKEIIKEITK